jgi:hypothetical protein
VLLSGALLHGLFVSLASLLLFIRSVTAPRMLSLSYRKTFSSQGL